MCTYVSSLRQNISVKVLLGKKLDRPDVAADAHRAARAAEVLRAIRAADVSMRSGVRWTLVDPDAVISLRVSCRDDSQEACNSDALHLQESMLE